MATADYWSSADLKGVAYNGFVNEDVMQQIIDILDIDLPLTQRISTDGVSNSYTEWPQYTYDQPDLGNRAVDGEDAAQNDAKGGARVGSPQGVAGVDDRGGGGGAILELAQGSPVVGAPPGADHQGPQGTVDSPTHDGWASRP